MGLVSSNSWPHLNKLSYTVEGMTSSNVETEIKLRIDSVAGAKRLLERLGFSIVKRRVLEINTIFDTADGVLRSGRKLLRLREAGQRHTLAFKGPPRSSRFKSREEFESEYSDPASRWRILEGLGYAPVFRYEKYRTEFGRQGEPGVVTLDETPIGNYLEVEGAPRWIDRTARVLGYSTGDYITASYGRLYLEWCRKAGHTPGNMVFDARHRGKI